MQYDDSIQQLNNELGELLFNNGLLGKLALAILCIASIVLLIYALYRKIRGQWESAYYVLLCAGVLVWAGCSLIAEFLQAGSRAAEVLVILRNIGIVLIPALMCVHIQLQVSYKELKPVTVIFRLIVPALFILLALRDLFVPGFLIRTFPAFDDTQWYLLLFYTYSVICLIRAYLLCFNVFYQMPKHMRRSTRYLLLSVSAYSLLLAMDVLWSSTLSNLIPQGAAVDVLLPTAGPIALLVVIFPLYSALHLMPSEDVIVTSREFVVGGLSTSILVLGGRRQILDWNRNDWEEGYPLPRPLYKEPIDVYRKRILDTDIYRVSEHDSNIITAVSNGKEMHFLMHTREVRNSKRRFGYVVEISEITPVYTILRYFEEIAYFDHLTKLHNRNAYINFVQQIVEEENLPLLIFVGDVNGLKQLNDVHGHLLGDELLKQVSEIIEESAPPGAFLARVGGDEFVALMPHGTEYTANEFVQNVITLCSATHHEVYGSPSISWGYAIMTSTEQSYNDVFAQADAMMYAYKKGRNTFSSSGLLPE